MKILKMTKKKKRTGNLTNTARKTSPILARFFFKTYINCLFLKNTYNKDMQVFELYFNPKDEKKVLESFQHKPKDAYEGKIGRIYMVGEISDPEKKDHPLLQNLFHIAQECYYRETSSSPEKALKETLREVNEFIRERGCAGKLDVALISLKNFSVHLGKIGRIKIFLFNGEKVRDIGEELENTGSNLFSNMVSGKMEKTDKLAVLTPEIYSFFKKGKILEDVAKTALGKETMEKISVLQKEKFPDISGIALIMDHSISLKEKETKVISKKRKEIFSFRKMFFNALGSVIKIKIPKFKIKSPRIYIKKPSVKRKSIFLPLLLLGVIILGTLAIGIENNIRRNRQEAEILPIKEKIAQGKEESNLFLIKEALSDLELLIMEETRNKEEFENIYSSTKDDLFFLTKGEYLEEMNFIGEIKEIDPDKIISTNGRLYLFSSKSPKMSIFNIDSGEETLYELPIDKGLKFSSYSAGKITLFSLPDTIILIENETVSELNINLLPGEEEFISLDSFLGQPYFLNSVGEIIRYSERTPIPWIKEGEEKIEDGVSLAIDRSIFVLTSENKIHRYYRGEKEETFTPFLFPFLSNTTKIYTSPTTPLLIIDSNEKRLIIISKEGDVIKQFYNEKFTNLKDIAISPNDKKIYLLINKEVYSLEI